MNAQENKLIRLTQNPVISYEGMQGMSELIEKRIAALSIDNQVATAETVKSLKTMRATLNKEFSEYEEQRKFIKNALLKPYNDLEEQYKPLIAVKYQEADSLLKKKIYSVEDELKQEKTDKLTSYFAELCMSKDIDFVLFKDINLNVTLSASEKSLKEQVDAFVSKLEVDINTINILPEDDEFKAEALAEYKVSKDLNHSLKVIQERRRAKEAELKRQEQAKAEALARKEAEANLPKVAQPLQAPTVEKAPEILEATFTVKGTLSQLKGLKSFIINNNIELL